MKIAPLLLMEIGAIAISGAAIMPPAVAQGICRTENNGVERWGREFNTARTSPEMGGGHTQQEWCDTVINIVRGENPKSEITIGGSSETSQNHCAPFNCPQYQYTCTVHVKTDPIYYLKISPECPP
jgi:hypothetical protein